MPIMTCAPEDEILKLQKRLKDQSNHIVLLQERANPKFFVQSSPENARGAEFLSRRFDELGENFQKMV
jgi:hypothetical protein